MDKNNFNELVQLAREADLVKYFQDSGYTVSKKGQEYYVKEFPGLSINPEKRVWYHHYTNVGRTNNSLDCLTEVLGRNFKQAVYELTGVDVAERSVTPKSFKPRFPRRTPPPVPQTAVPKKEHRTVVMPERLPNHHKLYEYFCQQRKIPKEIVDELVNAELLYLTRERGYTNAVFVHRNEKGEAVGGEMHETDRRYRYKGMVENTGESVFTFCPFPAKDGKPKRAFIFESAIDLMSFYTFCTDKKKLEGVLLSSMAGVKQTIPKKLEAEGVKIISCVDNDDRGRKFEADNHFLRSEFVKSHLDYQGFKDWNELLVFKSENPNANLLEQHPQQEQKKTNFFMGGKR